MRQPGRRDAPSGRVLIGTAGPSSYRRQVYACWDDASVWVSVEAGGIQTEMSPELARELAELAVKAADRADEADR